MKAIETTAMVSPEGKLLIEVASDLPPGAHKVMLVIDESLATPIAPAAETAVPSTEVPKTAWAALRTHIGSVEMPEDWSKEHDHYLYGTPKREP